MGIKFLANERKQIKKIIRYFVILISVITVLWGCAFSQMKKDTPPKIIAYVPGWKNVQKMGIRAASLSHINYAFVKIRDGKPCFPNPEDEKNLYYLASLKSQNPQLKILLSVGGWNGSKYFSDVARTDSSRRKFVSSLAVMVTMYNLDGIDIDWEYPGQEGAGNHYLPEDKWNFSLLLEDLRVALNRMAFLRQDHQNYLLTIAAAANRSWIDHVVMTDILKVVDFINVMSYDFYGQWDEKTGHHTNLYVSADEPYGNSVNQSVELFEKAGVPPEKLVIGGACYGYWWSGVEKKNKGLYRNSTGTRGSWSYKTIVDSILKIPGYHQLWDKRAKAPYLWNEKQTIFVSYENPRSLQAKSRYVLKKKLGGIMFWEYSGDDQGRLLDAIVNTLK